MNDPKIEPGRWLAQITLGRYGTRLTNRAPHELSATIVFDVEVAVQRGDLFKALAEELLALTQGADPK